MIRDIIVREVRDDISFSVERSELETHGDYSSNIALARAKIERKAPLEIAASIAAQIKEKYSNIFHAIEVAPPGFLNFYLAPEFLRAQVADLLKPVKKKNLGRASVEFISANPTGPLHVGNARSGPIGDVIANLLIEQGYKVTREYYHNDAGAQMGKLTATMWHWYMEACGKKSEFPEDGYPGNHLEIIARQAKKKFSIKLLTDKKGQTKLTEFTFSALEKENFETIKSMGIQFDRIVRESNLAKTKTKKVLAELKKRGLIKKKDGAEWFSPSEEIEAVVEKSDGTLIYFANDIAYHKEKFIKNDFVVDVFGENHEAHIPKLYAVADVFGFARENLKVVVYGHVSLKEGEKVIAMSKRKGNFVTASEVIKAVGADAFRFFMLEHSPRSSMQFDLKLAKAKSKENPVYYVQYAHARTLGILRKSKMKIDLKKADWSLLETLPEIRLIKQILLGTEVVGMTTLDYGVQRLTRYAYELARSFTHFYETTLVIGDDKKLTASRLALVMLTRDTLRHISKLLGISTPDKM